MVRFLNEELSKGYFVSTYIQMFKRILLIGDIEKLSAREEALLEFETDSCELFFDAFVNQHGRAPDEGVLSEQVQSNLLKRSHLFMRKTQIIDEENFVLSHLDQVKSMKGMEREAFVEDGYAHVLEREKKLACEYFRKQDDYPEGYDELIISRSVLAINRGLEKLLTDFRESFQLYYRKYRRGLT